MKVLFSSILLLLLSQFSLAQGKFLTLTGKVINVETQETIPGSNVYFSGTTIGTMTDENGNFVISDIRPGKYELIISHVSYELRSFTLEFTSKNLSLGNINVKEKLLETTFAEVKDKVDRKWRRQFTTFKRYMLGQYYREREIAIPNAYVAEFEVKEGKLTRKEPFTIEIQNSYTGYQIHYPVQDFLIGTSVEQFIVGYPRFTEMVPETNKQREKWKKNRIASYKGSLKHFFKSLLDNQLDQNLFECILTDYDPTKSRLWNQAPGRNRYVEALKEWENELDGLLEIQNTTNPNIKRIRLKDYLEIKYKGELGPTGKGQVSYIKANSGYIYVYNNGLPVDPKSITAYGYLTNEGLYELLPEDFQYEVTQDSIVDFVVDRSNPFENISHNLEGLISQYPIEKTYLHLAKPYYGKGDELWYKAYAVAGPDQIPTPLSTNLHVQLINPQNEIISQHTVQLANGVAKGNFTLADSLPAGNYRIQGFTKWMLNFDKEHTFNQNFEIVDETTTERVATPTSKPTNIRFFPEGGELINGIRSKVAFEIFSSDTITSGQILDDQDKVIESFQASHNGLGAFFLAPKPGTKYYGRLNGSTDKFQLPTARDSGFTLEISEESDDQMIALNIKTISSSDQKNEGFLIAHTRGIIGFATKIEWKGEQASIRFPKYNFNPGVIHITLFNKNWEPEAERLTFRSLKHADLKVQVSTEQDLYAPRDSTTVKLKVTDIQGNPIQGSFSLAAIDTKQISPQAFYQSIESSLLLTSDINGTLERPLQYLDTSDSLSSEKLDLVLLTKGWRKFVWNDIQTKSYPEIIFKEERGISIVGRAFKKKSKKPVSERVVKQFGLSSGKPNFNTSITDLSGSFAFNNLSFEENTSYLKLDGKKASKIGIAVDRFEGLATFTQPVFNPIQIGAIKGRQMFQPSAEEFQKFILRDDQRKNIDSVYNFDRVTDLGTVLVQGSKNTEISSNISRGLIFNRGEYSYSVSDLMGSGQKFLNALYVLQGRVPGLTIVMGAEAGEPTVKLNRKVWSLSNPDPPTLYLLDDSPSDLSVITSVPAEQIERIEVFKGMKATGIYGPSANGGVIAFYTKTSDEFNRFYDKLEEIKADDASLLKIIQGYHIAREFYSPIYRSDLPEHIKPDYRDLIHWEPMIQTNEFGEAQVTYFNADLETTVQIRVEGVTETGLPVSRNIGYNVVKDKK